MPFEPIEEHTDELPRPHSMGMSFEVLAQLSPQLADGWRTQYGECAVVVLDERDFDALRIGAAVAPDIAGASAGERPPGVVQHAAKYVALGTVFGATVVGLIGWLW